MTLDFDVDKYHEALRKYDIVEPYIITEGIHRYLAPNAPESVKQVYKELMYWGKKSRECTSVTGEYIW